jgi:hypothetical protein
MANFKFGQKISNSNVGLTSGSKSVRCRDAKTVSILATPADKPGLVVDEEGVLEWKRRGLGSRGVYGALLRSLVFIMLVAAVHLCSIVLQSLVIPGYLVRVVGMDRGISSEAIPGTQVQNSKVVSGALSDDIRWCSG